MYFIIWILANFPAFENAWWYYDDYIEGQWINQSLENKTFWKSIDDSIDKSSLSNGRPFNALWLKSFILDGNPDRELNNILIRLFQAFIHSISSVLILIIFSKTENKWNSAFAVLPFLLWPYNAEVTLWRSAGAYVLACFFGLLGLFFIYRAKTERYSKLLIGSFLIIVSMLTNQVAALSGMVIWLIILSLNLIHDQFKHYRNILIKSGIILTISYIIGGIISLAISYLYKSPYHDRANISLDILSKSWFYIELIFFSFLSTKHYSFWIISSVITLSFFSLVLIIKRIYYILSYKCKIISTLIIITTLVSPYFTLLIVSESWPSWRVMYLSPLLFSFFWLTFSRFSMDEKSVKIIGMILLSIILSGYIFIARINSKEYIILFEEDNKTLNQLKNFTKSINSNVINIYVVTSKIKNWNPYNLRYIHADSKNSAFFQPWTAHPFIEWFSTLKTTNDETIGKNCTDICLTNELDRFQFMYIEKNNTICVCP